MSLMKFTIGHKREIGASIRILAVVLAASALSGCYAAAPYTAVTAETYPNDYRKRHPIALREGNRVVEVFIGSNRSALTPRSGLTWCLSSRSGRANRPVAS